MTDELQLVEETKSPQARAREALSKGRHNIKEYFGEPYCKPPVHVPQHPIEGVTIVSWMEHLWIDDCFIPVSDTGPIFSHFYCAYCRCWRKVSTTITHMHDHFDNVTHSESRFQEKYAISRQMSVRLRIAIESFLVMNGLSMRLIKDERLKIIPGLPSRAAFEKWTSERARTIESRIRDILATVEECTISMDEWSDLSQRRYLGVTCYIYRQGEIEPLCLAHYCLNGSLAAMSRDQIKAGDIASLLEQIIKRYEINDKVKLCVTDRASVMELAMICLNEQRLSNGENAIVWGNCICHAFNSVLGEFVKLAHDHVQSVFELRRKLTGEVFTSFLIREKSQYLSIPSYSSVRWYSLFEMCKVLSSVRSLIAKFWSEHFKEPFPRETFDIIDQLNDVLKVVKEVTRGMESEEYSAICWALFGFEQIRRSVEALCCKSATYRDIYKEWIEYYNETVRQTKSNWNPILAVATFLNPGVEHAKLLNDQEVKDCLKYISSHECATEMANIQALERIANSRSSQTTTNIRLERPPISSQPGRMGTKGTNGPCPKASRSPLSGMIRLAAEHDVGTRARSVNEEVALYLTLKSPGLNPVEFWPQYTAQLPHLNAIASKIMWIIPTSAATERQFSACKRIQGIHRLHMNPDVFEDQVLITANPGIAETIFQDYQLRMEEGSGKVHDNK